MFYDSAEENCVYDTGINYCRSDRVDAHKDCHEDDCTCYCHRRN
jgi:hypothetical protein